MKIRIPLSAAVCATLVTREHKSQVDDAVVIPKTTILALTKTAVSIFYTFDRNNGYKPRPRRTAFLDF
jgi:hypothetical protein